MNFSDLTSLEAWRAFAPKLHIADPELLSGTDVFGTAPDARDGLMNRLKQEGYFQIGPVDWGVDLGVMAETVRALSAAKLSPVFAYLYDEFWVPFFKLHRVYGELLGDYALLPDFWIWNVDPAKSEAGWRPHRDKGVMALFPDGTPKSLTTWIPLTQATPLNGCMYMVPPRHDKTYGTPQEKDWQFDYASIRALPASPGDFLIWNQAVIHWGGKTSPYATGSRVSMAFEFQRLDVPAFNTPLIKPRAVLSFEQRLKLIAKQILQYKHMYPLDAQTTEWAQRVIA